MGYVKLVGTTNPNTNWTTEVVLERDDETGEVTKSAKQGEPVELTKDEQSKLEGLGFVFDKSSKDEHDKFVEEQETQTQQVGADIVGSAPLLGSPAAPAPAADTGDANDNK